MTFPSPSSAFLPTFSFIGILPPPKPLLKSTPPPRTLFSRDGDSWQRPHCDNTRAARTRANPRRAVLEDSNTSFGKGPGWHQMNTIRRPSLKSAPRTTMQQLRTSGAILVTGRKLHAIGILYTLPESLQMRFDCFVILGPFGACGQMLLK